MLDHHQKILQPDFTSYPEVRWWLAQGYHTDRVLENAVEKLHHMGFSACEVLTLTESSIDRQLYGWGSEEFNHDMLTIARKATELGMGFSFTSGPDWQPAIPGLNMNDEASGQELNFTNVNVRAGARFQGELEPYRHIKLENGAMEDMMMPGIPKGPNTNVYPKAEDLLHRYVATVAVRLAEGQDLDKVDLNSPRPQAPFFDFTGSFRPEPYETVYMVPGSSVVLTDQVEERAGRYYLSWQAPDDGDYVIFTFWRHSTAQVADSGNATSITINHLDRRGPEAQFAYWDEHIFTRKMDDIIAANGNVDFFQDSLEIHTIMGSGLWWCEDMPAEFQKRRGYSLIPYLPTLIHYNIRGMQNPAFLGDDAPPRFAFQGQPELYRRVLDDLHLTQTELYREYYLQPIRQWLNGHGVKLRAQASYGSPWVSFEMTLPQDSLDYQETETLEMCDIIDYYRIHSGGAHMYRQDRFSAETGAVGGRSYGVSLKEYLWKIHRLYAGGINRVITHGYATESGPDATTQWPGYDGIGFMFSERWGDRHPYGEMVQGFTAYLARMQAALRQGTGKMDVGILNLMFHSPKTVMISKSSESQEELLVWKDQGALAQAGYTYEFFAPQYLERFSSDGSTFDPDNTDYRALVVWQKTVPVASAEKLLSYARAGLPVVVVDGAGTEGLGLKEDSTRVQAIFAELRALDNVVCCADQAGVKEALKRLGILPRVSFACPCTLYTVYRDLGDRAYLFITNTGQDDVSTTLSVEGSFSPVRLDAWTGKAIPLGAYKTEGGRTMIPVSVRNGAAVLYALDPVSGAPHGNVECSGAQLICENGRLYAAASKPGSYVVALSDGSKARVNIEVREAPVVSQWELLVEDWKAGDKKEISETRQGHTTVEYYYETVKDIIRVSLDRLRLWKDIPEIGRAVSGIGRYRGSFMLPEDWTEQDGLIADLGTLHEMARVTVNGQLVQYADMMDPRVDISAFVRPGENEIRIEVSTTLLNRLIAMGRYQEGSPAFMSEETIAYQDYGLTQCALIPYGRRPVSLQ